MANTEIIDIIIQTTSEFFIYMLPVIGVMSGIVFLVTWLMSITLGLGRRSFNG